MTRKDYYAGISSRLERHEGNSPRLTKCNYLTGFEL